VDEQLRQRRAETYTGTPTTSRKKEYWEKESLKRGILKKLGREMKKDAWGPGPGGLFPAWDGGGTVNSGKGTNADDRFKHNIRSPFQKGKGT